MGLLGLRKFIDSCGCTRLLPVPVSDAEAEAEALRRLQVEGYREVTDEEGDGTTDAEYAQGLYFKGSLSNEYRNSRDDCQRGLTSSTHVNGGSAAAHTAGITTTPTVDHVLVDMNCIVHSCFNYQNSENRTKRQLIQEVLERLRVLLTEVVVPRQSLSICFDGPAPIAKLQTQRLRRRKASLLDTGSIQQLNTLSITAGSLFMIELENAIASQFKLNRGRGFLRRMCPVYLYGTTVMGEGEAKISRALAFLAYGPATETDGSAAGAGEESGGADSYDEYGAGQRGGHDRRGRRGGDSYYKRHLNSTTAAAAASNSSYPRYCPDDSVVVLGNDIDLVVTCLGATAFHNLNIISPSSLQLIRVSDIIYRWLKATSATLGDTPFSPAQLPSIRIDFIYLFLLNGGDHYVGAGEVAMPLWKRYRSVRATYPSSTLVSSNLDAVDIDFLADVLQASEYTGSSSVETGMNLLQSALWSLYTVVTGVCPDYNYVPEPEAPQLCHLRAAAAHCQRTNRRIRLPHFKAQSQPLTPLETYVALMPTEATLPKSVVAGLHSKPAYQSILKILETSNDTAMIAQAAKDAVEVSAPFLTTSEQYLRNFTSPVQLNVIPPRRRLSRHEQHRMLATQGHIQIEDPVPVVKPIAMAAEVPYAEVPYPAHTSFLDFCCPFDACLNAAESEEGACEGVNACNRGATTTTTVHGRTVSTRPSLHATAVTAAAPNHHSNHSKSISSASNGVEHKRVYLYQEEAVREQQERERKSAASKLQRTLNATSNLLQNGRHLSAPQERRMRRRLQRLQQAETEELRSRLAKEDLKYARWDRNDADALEEELRNFLGEHASSTDVKALLTTTAGGAKASKGSRPTASRRGGKMTKLRQAEGAAKGRTENSATRAKSAQKGEAAKTVEDSASKKGRRRERDRWTQMDTVAGHDIVLHSTDEVPSRLGDGDYGQSAESREHMRPLKRRRGQR
ncbi:hypothetical protein ABL78_1540 [Leptomonas seymouri]|uniref:Xrn1 N-terminal domain-containing protein n=1 Tax=Leptomonas seymouri TaxID=5684 RepID=A0A0N1IM29_LEPSE|nr:hypothetical protein ABL78_1540 [Leptomonas seymouri]|eukprot:KPI89311.1 hypothetical protein ABL78_1540 [Leptomonas seymouri]